MNEHISLGMEFRRLFAAFQLVDFRKQNRQQATLIQEIKAPHPRRMSENFYQLVPNALGTHDRDFGRFAAQSLPSRGLDLKTQNRRESHAPDQTELIFAKSRIRIADAPQHLGPKIRLPADIV